MARPEAKAPISARDMATRTSSGCRRIENGRHSSGKRSRSAYRDNPTVAAYDLLNEPYGDFHGEPPDLTIVTTVDELVHAVREVDQKAFDLCAGSLQGMAMYGAPASHGWKNVGYTEHFYPGLFGGVPSLETHARFVSLDLRGKRSCSSNGTCRSWPASSMWCSIRPAAQP